MGPDLAFKIPVGLLKNTDFAQWLTDCDAKSQRSGHSLPRSYRVLRHFFNKIDINLSKTAP